MVPVTKIKNEKPVPEADVSKAAASAQAPRVLVTGAAGGLGREIALQLAARGCRLGIADINAEALAGTAATARGAGAEVEEIASDLTLPDAPEAAVARIAGRWGGIDALVNNAGYGVIEPFLESTHAAWTRTLALNVTALAMCCKAAGRVMRDQRSGRIVNITSPGSRMALPDYTAYAASKAGVDSITRALAVALAPYGVLVNSLAPGMMDTKMQRSTEADLARRQGRADLQAFLDERTARVPLGRRAEVAEIAASVVWLALDAPAYMTAARLNVSGGLDKD
jgi:3-oxoacyl-[acyl-carrier protein] reductase